MKLTTIALASVFVLSGTVAFADTVRPAPSVRNYPMLHRGVPLTSTGVLRPNDGNPNGDPDGPTTLSGTGSSEFGGSSPGTSGYN
jgi:hypothetical protein